MRYSKIIVALCVLFTAVFTAAVIYVYTTGHVVPDTLIVCVFGMYGIELASCAGITITKVRQGAEMPRIETGDTNGKHTRDSGAEAGE